MPEKSAKGMEAASFYHKHFSLRAKSDCISNGAQDMTNLPTTQDLAT
tara:strand:+ start:3693 stop:3833 length:141 start_codon:yes stop_codon:yes gene_type:complete